LSPALDVNPTAQKVDHTLALDATVRIPDVEVVRETAALYRLSRAQANEIVQRVESAVETWRTVAREIDVPKDEVEAMAATFEERA